MKTLFCAGKTKKIHLFRSLEPGTTQAGVRPGSDAVSFISLWQRLREHNHHKPFNIMPHLEMCFPMIPCNFRLVRMVRSEQTLRCLTLEALVLPVSPPLFIPEQQNYHRCLLGFYNFYMIFYDDKLGWLKLLNLSVGFKSCNSSSKHYIPPHWEIHKVKPLSPVFQNKISNMNTS